MLKKRILMICGVFLVALLFSVIACDEQLPQYVIDVETNGGSTIESFVVEGNQSNLTLPTPTLEGHTFAGWYTDSNLNTKWDGQVSSSLTLYAKWSINSYTLSYETNGGEAIESVTLDYNANMPQHPTPVYEGRTFGGWYIDSELATPNNYTVMPAKDVKLYAKWTINRHSVEYYINGIHQTDYSDEVEYGSTVDSLPTEPYQKGYTFVGWFVDGKEFTTSTKVVDNIRVDAKFVINEYNLKFIVDGVVASESRMTYGSTINSIQVAPKLGYRFAGWTVLNPETGEYEAFSLQNATMPDKNLELVAAWDANQYSIVFDGNGGFSEVSMQNMSLTYDVEVALTTNTYQKTGYAFTGWSTSKNGTVEYVDKALVSNLTSEHNGVITLYAVWEANDYQVKFDANTGSGEMNVQNFVFDAKQKIAKNTFVKVGHTFAGWSLTADGAKVYADEEEVLNLTSKAGEVVTLYATWTINKHFVTFMSNGQEIAKVEYEYNSVIEEITAPDVTGHSFDGWYFEDDEYDFASSLMPDNDITLVALWTANNYKVTFETNGGTLADGLYEKELVYGSTVELLTPNRYGYTFNGWYTDSEFNNAVVVYKVPAEDSTLYAKWTPIQFKLTVVFDNGEENYEEMIDYESEFPTFEDPTKVGHTFAGWSESYEKMPDKNLVIYAQWTRNTYSITFVSNSGSEVSKIEGLYESKILTSTTTVRAGYTFIGWYRNEDLSGEEYIVPATIPSENITLYAKWDAYDYKILFDGNGGTSVDGMPEMNLEYNTSTNLSKNNYSKAGHTFVGWATSSTGEKVYDNEEEINILPKNNGEVITLYAVWTANGYTVVFHSNNGTNKTIDQAFVYDEAQNLRNNTFTYTGYTFVGWSTELDGTKKYDNLEEVVNLTEEINGEVNLYAIWDAYDYTIIFDGNGGNSQTQMKNMELEYTVAQKISKNLYSRDGYTFVGWSTSADGDKVYADEEEINILPNKDKDEITLYAVWNANSYKVVFHSNNGENKTSEQEFEYDIAQKLTANEFTYIGWKFLGWSETADGAVIYNNLAEVNNLSTKVDEKINLYAKWEKITYYFNVDYGYDNKVVSYPYYYNDVVQPVLDPTYEGHQFMYWSLGNEEFSFDTEFKMPAENVTITAIYENLYTIKFITNSTQTIPSISNIAGVDITTPTVDDREGYTFVGWFKDAELTEAYNIPATMPAENLTLYARWDRNTYTITFNSNGGSPVVAISKLFAEAITAPNNPTREGYSFVGWFKDEELTEAYVVPATMPAENATVYAKWEKATFTITFDSNEGSLVNAISKLFEEAITAPNNPTREGYSFVGWFKDEELTEAYVVPATMPAENVTVYAKWDRNTYTITFDSNEGSSVEAISKLFEEAITAPNNPTREGYTFIGWFKDEELTERYNVPETMPAENVTVYAKWDRNTYTITFDSNEGSSVEAISKLFEEAITAPNNPTREGYNFVGWFKDEELTERYNIPATMPAENVTVYAKWDRNTYTITFNSNGGSPVNAISKLFEEAITVPAEPTKEGYNFVGWFKDEELSEVYLIPATMPAESVTVYAKWEKATFTITFNSNGGSPVNAISKLFEEAITAPNNPTKEGYNFIGWFKDEELTEAYNIPEAMPAENVTVYAKWEKAIFTITFNSNGGSDVETISQEFGSDIIVSENPKKDGYNFAGWYKNEDLSGERYYVPTTMPAENITLYAKWEAYTYTVKFNANGGSAETTMSNMNFEYNIAQKLTANIYSKLGHNFVGWSTELNGEKVYDNAESVTILSLVDDEIINLYAVWEAYTYTVVFNPNGGTSDVEMIDMEFKYNIEQALSKNTFTKLGHNFVGWSTKENSEEADYDDEEKITITSLTDCEVITLYAVWTPYTYTVVFNPNGGTSDAAMEDMSFKYNKAQALSKNIYSKVGHRFDGWATEKDGQGVYGDGETITITSLNYEEPITLYAVWTRLEYKITINIAKTAFDNGLNKEFEHILYDTLLTDFMIANKITFDRFGYNYSITLNGKVVSTIDGITIKDTTVIDVTYEALPYTIDFVVNNAIVHTVNAKFGEELKIEDITADLKALYEALDEIRLITYGLIKGTDGGESYMKLLSFCGDAEKVALIASLAEYDNSTYNLIATSFAAINKVKDNPAALPADAIIALHETSNLAAVSFKTAYDQIAFPTSGTKVFVGWYLGTNTYYLKDVNGEYEDKVPGTTIERGQVYAKFDDFAFNLEEKNYSADKTLSWTSQTESFIENILKEYYGYNDETKDLFIIEYSLYDVNSGLLLASELTETTYQFATENTFRFPGSYKVSVVANIKIMDSIEEDAKVVKELATKYGTTVVVNIEPVVDNPTMVTSGKYYYVLNEDGVNYLYLFTNTTYEFSNDMVFSSFEDLISVEEDQIEDYTKFKTNSTVGDCKVTSGDTEYYVRVLPIITDFSFNESLDKFAYTTKNIESTLFLNKNINPYLIGNAVSGLTITDYVNNGVNLDVVATSDNNVVYNKDLFDGYFSYEFYYLDGNNWVKLENSALDNFVTDNRDLTRGGWEFNGDPNVSYKVVVKINKFCIPAALSNYVDSNVELIFKVNDCLNIYSHETLKSVYANLNYRNGINIHSDIKAELSDEEYYTAYALENNPLFDLLISMKDNVSLNVAAYAEKRIPFAEERNAYLKSKGWKNLVSDENGHVHFDGSPLNFELYELSYAFEKAWEMYRDNIVESELDTYKDYFDYLATLKFGYVYFRGAYVPESYTENYQINGNYFEINGQDLPYITCTSIRNLSDMPGYEIPQSQSAIFAYAISTYKSPENEKYKATYYEINEKNNATVNLNNISITSNTSTTHQSGDDLTVSAVKLMNRNAGGYAGFGNFFGGTLKTFNAVIRGATIGINLKYESQLFVDYTYLGNNWANSIYSLDGGDISVTNSHIKDSGGAAIHVEDSESNSTYNNSQESDNTVTLDTNTIIDNYISGTEGYFYAYQMTHQVVAIKGKLEPGLNGAGFTSIKEETNQQGFKYEMINFIFMGVGAGTNSEQNGSNALWLLDFNMSVDVNLPTGQVATQKFTHNSNTSSDTIVPLEYFFNGTTLVPTHAYFLHSEKVDGKGKLVLGFTIDLK